MNDSSVEKNQIIRSKVWKTEAADGKKLLIGCPHPMSWFEYQWRLKKPLGEIQLQKKNIAKGITDPRVEFISQVLRQILIKFHFQNLN